MMGDIFNPLIDLINFKYMWPTKNHYQNSDDGFSDLAESITLNPGTYAWLRKENRTYPGSDESIVVLLANCFIGEIELSMA